MLEHYHYKYRCNQSQKVSKETTVEVRLRVAFQTVWKENIYYLWSETTAYEAEEHLLRNVSGATNWNELHELF